jgi:hypothetical protein
LTLALDRLVMPAVDVFADNIRLDIGDLTELRQSLQEFGWNPEFPAIVDENGIVLVGNRRMKIA